MQFNKLLKGGVGSGQRGHHSLPKPTKVSSWMATDKEPNYGSFLNHSSFNPVPSNTSSRSSTVASNNTPLSTKAKEVFASAIHTAQRVGDNLKHILTKPLPEVHAAYRRAYADLQRQYRTTRPVNPLDAGMHLLGFKNEDTSMNLSLILKGKGPKGHSWKLVGGKRVYTNSGGTATPTASTPTSTTTTSRSAFPSQTFHDVGAIFGGTKFTNNVMLHKDKADAENHEGFIHGHLTDAGYQHKGTTSTSTGTTSTYEHPDGSKVTLNNGLSNGKHFLGYTHTEGQAASQTPSQSTPKEALATHSSAKGYSPEEIKNGTSIHTKRTSDRDEAVSLAQDFHNHATSNGFTHEHTTDHKGVGVTVSQFKHPDGDLAQSVVTNNGHAFSHTPPKATNPTTSTLSLKAKDLKKLADLTDENFHGEAIAHGSKMLGRDDLHKEAKAITKEHIKAGGLTQELMDRRNSVYTKMMDHAKAKLSPSDFEKFHGAF